MQKYPISSTKEDILEELEELKQSLMWGKFIHLSCRTPAKQIPGYLYQPKDLWQNDGMQCMNYVTKKVATFKR